MTCISKVAANADPAATTTKSPLRSPSVGAVIGSTHAKEAPRGEKTCMNGYCSSIRMSMRRYASTTDATGDSEPAGETEADGIGDAAGERDGFEPGADLR